MKRVLTVTMNPAVDAASAVDELTPGRKLRCAEPRYDPGGGGINVSRTIKEIGGTSTALVMAGGPNGERLRAMLDERGIDVRWARADGDTRVDLTITERASGEHYRLVMPGARQPPERTDEALAALDELIGGDRFGYVVASGSLPPGVPDDFYARLADVARRHGARLVLDTSGPALKAALRAGGLYLVRPDRHEAREIAERPDEAPMQLARHLVECAAAEVVIITRGPDGAVLASRDGQEADIPGLGTAVVSTVGAGDSFVGALVHALANDWSLVEATRLAVAAAAAAVTTEATELAKKADIERLYRALPAAR